MKHKKENYVNSICKTFVFLVVFEVETFCAVIQTSSALNRTSKARRVSLRHLPFILGDLFWCR